MKEGRNVPGRPEDRPEDQARADSPDEDGKDSRRAYHAEGGGYREQLGGAKQLDPERLDFSAEQSYRAFHWRLHNAADPVGRAAIRDMREPHFHDPDPPEDSIDRAIECLMENRDWGWKEIAAITGLVAAFPDGKLATRVDGEIQHHESIEDATDRLVKATKEAARVAKARRPRAGRRS
jgi:hypothetical protein